MEALSIIGDLGLNVVDDEEIEKCRKLFHMYDEDKDGKLTYAELLTCVRCCGRNPSVDEFKEMVQIIDTKLDGALDFDDFMSLYVMQLKDGPNNEAEMLEAFQAFDKAGNGFIMVDDLKHILTNMGADRLTPEEAEMMLRLADKDGDGVLNYEEIIQILASDGAESKDEGKGKA